MRKEYKFYVYILTNYSKDVFYVGFTNNIIRRIIEHKNGFGSKFTAKYRLNCLVRYEETENVISAIEREKEIKGWRREKKLSLVKSDNANLDDLSGGLFKDLGISEIEIRGIVNELKNRYKA
ncbi:MAG: GIY-YIG nuclease family protein [Candidatus Paceibacterota bacterium]|jgi:putative endonuclease